MAKCIIIIIILLSWQIFLLGGVWSVLVGFVAWRNALESKGLKVNISKTKVMRCAWDGAPKEAAVDPCSVCVWKEGGCELNPLCNMWLLGTRAMFRSARNFGKSGTGLCVQSV